MFPLLDLSLQDRINKEEISKLKEEIKIKDDLHKKVVSRLDEKIIECEKVGESNQKLVLKNDKLEEELKKFKEELAKDKNENVSKPRTRVAKKRKLPTDKENIEGEGHDIAKKTIRMTVNTAAFDQRIIYQPVMVRGLSWQIFVKKLKNTADCYTDWPNSFSLGFSFQCKSTVISNTWNCTASATLRVMPYDDSIEPITGKISHCFNSRNDSSGYLDFIRGGYNGIPLSWDDLNDPAKGYCSPNHELVLEAEVFVHAQTGAIDSE